MKVQNVNVESEKWKMAQERECKEWSGLRKRRDDWNIWWKEKFDNYFFVKNRNINSLLEVGCGPFAQNIRYIMSELPNKNPNVALNDPLLNSYLQFGSFVTTLPAKHYNCPLEELVIEERYDCVICINVLGHVYDVKKCMENIKGILNPQGLLILGEDLTNEEDAISCPDVLTDMMHPVRFEYEYLVPYLNEYKTIYKKMLPRQDGRNPVAHYSTLLFAGEK